MRSEREIAFSVLEVCRCKGGKMPSSVMRAGGFLLVLASLPFTLLGNEEARGRSVFDLRWIEDLRPGKSFALNGGWEFYQEKLVLPGEIAVTGAEPDDIREITSRWYGGVSSSDEKGGKGSYRTIVYLHEPGGALGLWVPGSWFYDFIVFVNGKAFSRRDIIESPHLHSSQRQVANIIPLPDEKELEIIVQVLGATGRRHGVFSRPFLIGNFNNLLKERRRADFRSTLLLGILVSIGIFCLILFVRPQKDLSLLYFGLFTLVMALRTAIQGENLFSSLFPGLPFAMEAFLANATYHLTTPLLVLYVMSVLDREAHYRTIKKVVIAVSLLSLVLTTLTNEHFAIYLFNLYGIFRAVIVAFLVLLLIPMTVTGEWEAGLCLLGQLPLLIFNFYDTLSMRGILPSVNLTTVGILLFSIVQLVLLNVKFVKSFKKTENLARKLLATSIAYGRFVPKEFLTYLGKKHITEVSLGDHVEQIMTVLFCDIRGFTYLSEHMTSEQTFLFVNEFLEQSCPTIREHGGFIDKYTGDGFMALFPGKADKALTAALSVKGKLREYNEVRDRHFVPAIKIGIGLHTGELMLGTVGENRRLENTVISNAVNLCARIEKMTKEYGFEIAFSEETYRALAHPKRYNIEYFGEVSLRGSDRPMRIYHAIVDSQNEVKQIEGSLLEEN